MSADPLMLESHRLESHRLESHRLEGQQRIALDRPSRQRRMIEGAVSAVAIGLVELAWFSLVALAIFALVR